MFFFRKEFFTLCMKDKVSIFIAFLIEAFIVPIDIMLQILESIKITFANINNLVCGINNVSWFVFSKFTPVQSSNPLNRISTFEIFWIVIHLFETLIVFGSKFLRKPLWFDIWNCIWRRKSSFLGFFSLVDLFGLVFSLNWLFLFHFKFDYNYPGFMAPK